MPARLWSTLAASTLAVCACSDAPVSAPLLADDVVDKPDPIAAALGHPARPEEDRVRDELRKPDAFMRAVGIAEGQRILEMGSGFGYMVTLLAAVVGPRGTVVAHNPPDWAAFPAPEWAQNRATPFEKGVVEEHVAPWESPVPEGASFDIVLSSFAYHEALLAHADLDAMNRNVFAGLRPGGAYVVSDLHAAAGTSDEECRRLHRIERDRVQREVEAAGFTLERELDLYANPDDDRSVPTCCEELPGSQDRFILIFRRLE